MNMQFPAHTGALTPQNTTMRFLCMVKSDVLLCDLTATLRPIQRAGSGAPRLHRCVSQWSRPDLHKMSVEVMKSTEFDKPVAIF